MREKIYNIIEPKAREYDNANGYDTFMMIVILCSFVPLMFKEETPVLAWLEISTASIFALDYVLRWMTADFKLGKRGIQSFLRYPFTPMAIIDLLSILPIVLAISPAFKLFRFTRLILIIRFFRLFRLVRYSKNLRIIMNVFQKQKYAFLMILILTLGYIFVTAAILFQIEPDTFDNFFDAIYWSVMLLTTVGYGDITATTMMGKLITVLSALVGIAVVALPAGLIVAGYLNEVQGIKGVFRTERTGEDEETDEDKEGGN
ncbi:MAG: ion transporter [Firmicutes bacterium]|nr:ion transporter [Bacillota bacterium]